MVMKMVMSMVLAVAAVVVGEGLLRGHFRERVLQQPLVLKVAKDAYPMTLGSPFAAHQGHCRARSCRDRCVVSSPEK